jgi:NADH-quinone oxidoreductase subunit N
MNSSLDSHVTEVALLLILLSLTFQLGAFPMCVIFPDIYEGAPTPVSAFIAVGFRTAGFALTTRLLLVMFAQPGAVLGQWRMIGDLNWPNVLVIIASFTMGMGAFLAFRQHRAKRMVGHLVIAETGFFLMGLLVLDEVGIAALLYGLVVELFALMGSFHVLAFIFDEFQSDQFSHLHGRLRYVVPECVFLIFFLLCLVGCPPFPGFVGKFALLGIIFQHQRFVLGGVAIGAMVVSMIAVGRLSYALFGALFDQKCEDTDLQIEKNSLRRLLLIGLATPIVLIGIFSEFILNWASQSLHFIFW